MIINEDKTIYLYYTNDAEYRAKLVGGLNDSIAKVDNLDISKYNASDVARVQAKAAEARALLNRTAPNKAFSPELLNTLNELNALLNGMGIRTQSTPNNRGGGGRGSSGGGSSRGSSGGGAASSNAGRGRANTWSGSTPIAVGVGGNWELINPEEAAKNLDNSKWIFKLTTGERVTGWQLLSYTFEGRTKVEWYHFEQDGIMDSGWFLDRDTNKWYYLSMNHDGFFGEMIKGWHHDPDDTRWYFLDRNDGHMHVSWDKIDGNWYFFNPNPPAQTWFFDNSTGRWNYGDNKDIRPLGSMYVNEETPDGFHVNADGVWQ